MGLMKGFFFLQAIPRTIWLDVSGKQLIQWPIEEIQKLRKDKVNLTNKVLKKGSLIEVKGVTAVQVRIVFNLSNNILKNTTKEMSLLFKVCLILFFHFLFLVCFWYNYRQMLRFHLK